METDLKFELTLAVAGMEDGKVSKLISTNGLPRSGQFTVSPTTGNNTLHNAMHFLFILFFFIC